MTTHQKSKSAILGWVLAALCFKMLLDGLFIYLWDKSIAELIAEFLTSLSM